MTCCSPKCQKWSIISTSVFFLVIGTVLSVLWERLFNTVVKQQLSLRNDKTMLYSMWKETPIPMYLEVYLFNWSNPDEVLTSKWTVKPKLVEMGPYVWREHHIRENVTFNNNDTVSFQTKRIWHLDKELTKGSIDDKVTVLNPILATVGYIVRHKHILVRKGVNFFLKEKKTPFIVTKTVREFMFDGYDDPLLDLVQKLHIKGLKIPFKTFGWFVTRNSSSEYDGNWTMYTGADDIEKLGLFSLWNGLDHTNIYPGECGRVIGTSGELWYPPKDNETIALFTPDACSTITLHLDKSVESHGIQGNRYIGQADVFDNGSTYQEQACFSPGDVLPSGVRNVSQCKFGAPAFMSFPHFYLADDSYRKDVDGMKPDASTHQFMIDLEPNTGVPLQVEAMIQVNLHLLNITGIDLLQDVKQLMMPMLWFKQAAYMTDDLATEIKLVLVMPSVGTYTGYGCIGLGVLLATVAVYLSVGRGRKEIEEERILGKDHS